jgi:hypothetical protein
MRPSGLCRSQNYEMRAGADDTQSGRHILKVGILCLTTSTRKGWEALGETTTLQTSKPSTTGAIQKRAR